MSTWRLMLLLVPCAVQYAFGAPNPIRLAADLERRHGIPSYVAAYAPLLYLHTDEAYFPSDIGQQLVHTTPRLHDQTITDAPDPLSLDNLDQLNSFGTKREVYLTSKDEIELLPSWFSGIRPDSAGKVNGGTTCAVIVVDKGFGVVDAFYFYFYAYNQGNRIEFLGEIDLGEFGDHVGDWEHTAIRFHDGVPQSLWLSQHSSGEAFTYSAMEKSGIRPLVYAGNGTHANWATPGDHDHTIPGIILPTGILLTDHTSKGSLYDPIQSAYFYSYDTSLQNFHPYSPIYPVNWLNFTAHWGNVRPPLSSPGQITIFGQPKYLSGPTGPIQKSLNRTSICNEKTLHGGACTVSPILTARLASAGAGVFRAIKFTARSVRGVQNFVAHLGVLHQSLRADGGKEVREGLESQGFRGGWTTSWFLRKGKGVRRGDLK